VGPLAAEVPELAEKELREEVPPAEEVPEPAEEPKKRM
jgi:hypothetical protein